ncbi:MAG: amidohydrolase [Blastopirellula sp.]|nr:MAG: amidohydrolase [Blastopirellula sp.]
MPESSDITPQQRVQLIDTQLAHLWMVRTFLKHAEETEEDEELQEVARDLYDYMLALGNPLSSEDWPGYLKTAKKKLARLKRTDVLFQEIQPEISNHTNFKMAAVSCHEVVSEVERLLGS